MDDTAVLRSKKVTIPDNKQKDWTPEEDTLLEQLVQKHIALPDPTIWYKVAGGGIDGSHLLRSVAACQRRWKTLHPSPIFSTGRWTKKENHLLQQSISEQFDGKYQVAVDVLDDSLPEQTRKELQQKFERRYLNMSLVAPQFSLPMLKWGSQRLRKLDWIKISEHVKSRDQYTCRGHFYGVYDNGRRGVLTKDELERLEEGLRLFENDYWKISKHVGTRSTPQVTKFIALKGWLKTKQADSENSTPKDPEIKQ
ncbi:hypothetical protein FBU30_006657 [Linnemannia zychae]|nr:hypothetical protein FBU30_006657 [Linnemannia zychae]